MNFIKNDKKLLVFSSHGHGDHFNSEILKWKEKNSKVEYVLSDDIKAEVKKYFVKEGDTLSIDGLEIKVFGSSDLGVSYFVKCDGKRFFHSGDLNWWAWPDDTPKEEEDMRDLYMSKMKKIVENIEKVDYLFYPVDPRLEENSFLGVEDFIKRVEVKNIIPMHMWDKYKIAEELEKRVNINVIRIVKNCEKIFEI